MELYQLRSFLEIASTKNLTRASEQLNISQSALSSQIRLLEDELTVRLFHRSAKGMALTEQGRILQSYAQDVVKAAEAMQEKAKKISGRNFGVCRIGLNTDGAFLRVSRLSRALGDFLPDVNMIFVSSQTTRTPEMLKQGLIDIGFFFGECAESNIATRVVCNFRVAIVIPESVLPRGSNLDWTSAAVLPWIWSVSDCPYYRVVQEKFDSQGLAPRKVVDAMDEDVVRELVIDGKGLAILREDEAEMVVARGNAWIWDDIRFTLPLQLGWLKGGEADSIIETVLGIVATIWDDSADSVDPSIGL